jgi:hypothetical protein
MRMWHRLRNLPVGSTTRVGGSVFPRVSVSVVSGSPATFHTHSLSSVFGTLSISSTTITISCESCRLILRRFFPSIEVGVDDLLRVPLGVYVHCGWST